MPEALRETAILLKHALLHTLEHSWYMLPLLLLVYLVIELVEHKAMDKVRAVLASRRLGIIGAAALGLFPQCGFSVAAANLYAEKLVSAGTVAAVFVATSDEALPILIAEPESAKWVLPVMLLKFVYAIVTGLIVNAVFMLTRLDKLAPHASHHHHGEHVHEGGEHHHCAHCDSNRGIFSAALKRSLSIFAFVFVTSLLFNLAVEIISEDTLKSVLMTDSPLQPFLAALVGLIPNCSASVITTELFISGILGFGSLMSALCAGAGMGILVMFRVNKNHKQNFAILGMIYTMSALLGVVMQLFI